MMYQPQSIRHGLKLLRTAFTEYTEDHEPLIQIDQSNCPIFVSALSGGYHMDELGEEPKKDGFYDHSVDTARYGIVGLDDPGRLRTEKPLNSVEYDPNQDPY